MRLTVDQKRALKELGRIGGQTRAKNLPPWRRMEIAHKASLAAAKARTLKAKKKRA